ncbi:MAG: DNA-binding response regulator [Bacteroidetes bacterium]|nr:MAG: DNA-binding response regulator [Bacteroidota bacterium]
MKIKVLIADDHQLFREGLINLLSSSKEIDIIAHADNGKDAYEKAIIYNPDVILMDISMPVMNGEESTRLVKKQNPSIKVIALTMHSDKHYIKTMLEAGVDGYLFKNCTYNQLIEAIKTVVAGEKYLSGDITETLIDDYLNTENSSENKESELTEREMDVLKLYAEGKTTREISEALFVSIKTVGTHRQHIMEKLDIKTTVEMIRYALKKGIISLD